MTDSQTPLRSRGLAELAPAYGGLFCDVWGVVHNGAVAHAGAVDALTRFRQAGGRVIFITNAPRRRRYIAQQLDELGISRAAYDDIVTSGDAARDLLRARAPVRLFHVGAEVHLPLYDGLDVELVDEESCEVVCCTGQFDEERETPDDYEPRMLRWQARGVPMICVNPDIVVERGGSLIWCAGALARAYSALGGATEIVGKPYPPVYRTAHRRLAAANGGGSGDSGAGVLAIGDGVETDLRGAAENGIDAIFVTAGVHAAEFGDRSNPDADAVHRFLAAAGVGVVAFMPHLVW